MTRREHAPEVRKLLEHAIRKDEQSWLMAAEEDALRYLKECETADWTVIYACFAHVYMHTVLVPAERLRDAADRRKLTRESFPSPEDSWRINYCTTWPGRRTCAFG